MSGIVNIRGKEYKTVALRVSEFREHHKNFTISTDIVENSARVIIKASVLDESGRLIATGYAEEERGSSNINTTSALENCETSAIGRALACFGFGGSEYASANEVTEAILQQAKNEVVEYFLTYNKLVSSEIDAIYQLKTAIVNDEKELAIGAWHDLDQKVREKLVGLAPTKGGIFTTEERAYLRQPEFGGNAP